MIGAQGSHEDYSQLDTAPVDHEGMRILRPGVRAVQRGHVWERHGCVWMGFGGTPSIDGPGGPAWWPQVRGPVIARDGEVTEDLGGWWLGERITGADVDLAVGEVSAVESAGRQVEVMITHDAPLWVDLHLNGPHWPLGVEQRHLLTEAVDGARPDVLVCGQHHRHTVAPGPHGGVGWPYQPMSTVTSPSG